MPLDSVAGLVDALRLSKLLEPAHLSELDGLSARFPEPRALAAELIRREWLTPYQANQLLQGRGADLLLGSYVLLERVGAGGMGQVFKARNWKLGRVVALKLVRKDRLDNPDAVRRFQREIRAAAQLVHPHIVHAFDADAVHGAHFFVMEYVEGTDLSKLVKKEGPLAVAAACDYARQAALGLEFAYQHGVVHRDVKPQNLLLTTQGVVKILDLGLARLSHGDEEAEASTTMTREGAVMGTPDYMAPEQTLDSHTVDVRADLYSLGCTLYFLLTGKVPFPGGSLGEKIAKHQMREPVAVEERRPETPAAVARVVRKLMAKRPEDRYQTPAEAAAALASVSAGDLSGTVALVNGAEPPPAREAFAGLSSQGTTVPSAAASPARPRPVRWRRWLLVGAANAVVLAGLVGLLAFLLRPAAPPHDARPPAPAAPPERKAPSAPPTDHWLEETAALPAERQVRAVAARLKDRNPGFDGTLTPEVEGDAIIGLEFSTETVTDLSPLRALPALRRLRCSARGQGRLWDLLPLKGMRLTDLNCGGGRVSDLSPLRDMPLYRLDCNSTPVSDLSPLRGLRLSFLDCGDTGVSDLSPLRGMPLTFLACPHTPVSDLSPLQNLPLTFLRIDGTKVTDLTPLKNVPLKALACDFDARRDAEAMRAIKTLDTINGKPAADFWKEMDHPLPPGP